MSATETNEELLARFKECDALLEGHFKLSSGLHSTHYLQCALLFKSAAFAEPIVKDAAGLWADTQIDAVIGPALGGVVFAYELARQLGVDGFFSERVQGEQTLRRGFGVTKGQKILLAEDVITTGKSALETMDMIEKLGGDVVGVTSIVNRSSKDIVFDVPFRSLITFSPPVYDPADCPLCKDGVPIDSPGSRFLK